MDIYLSKVLESVELCPYGLVQILFIYYRPLILEKL